jgi:ATP-dependent helicase/nuclease subunit A
MDVEYAFSVDFSANKVKLMSMHKSKGLEFPYTYYIGLDNKFNYTENKSFFVFDKTYGLITKAFDNGFYDTYLKTLIERKNYQTYISERMRLFYVALTRTKEKMVLILNQNKVKDFPLHYNQSHVLSLAIRRNYHSQLDIVSSIPEIIPWFQNKTVEFKPQLKVDALIQNQMYHFNKFNYQAKEVVSTHYSKPSFHMIDAETKIKMQKGIAIHHQFEIFDFKSIDISLSKLDSYIYLLFEKFFLRFPKTLFEKAEIYQEYEFYEETSLELKHGIIDLIIVNEKEITVIDYKLKNIEDELYILQVDGYAKYLHKLLNKPVKAFLYSIISGETKEVVFHATNT